MKKLLIISFSLIILSNFLGCSSIEREITKKIYQPNRKKTKKCKSYSRGKYTTALYKFTNSEANDLQFEGVLESKDTIISYQKGLQPQAEQINKEINQIIDGIEDKTAIDIFIKPRIYLIRVDTYPRNIEFSFENEPNQFAFPMFVEAENQHVNQILSQNTLYPCIIAHELTEMSLFHPSSNLLVIGDPEFNLFVLKWQIKHYTRWFRDGFAQYTALIALRTTAKKLSAKQIDQRTKLFGKPFSSLSNIGKKLFKWHQFSNDSFDYYGAALGLFLLIEKEFGQGKIKEIVMGLNNLEYADGRALVKLFNETLDTDIVQYTEDFEFPSLGLEMKALTLAAVLNKGLKIKSGLLVEEVAPNSFASQAGIQKNDVIIKVNDRTILSHLDFELAIFDCLKEAYIDITTYRQEEGISELQIQIYK